MKKILLSAAFFTFAPIVLFASVVYLSFLTYKNYDLASTLGRSNSVAFAALPTNDLNLIDEIESQDSRVENLKSFFKKHESPLEPHAEEFVDAALKYDLDYRLLPAIAMQESNLCKKTPKESFNCWGFGVYGKKVTRFEDYGQAIEAVSKTLSEKYKAIGLVTPEQIMTKYTPSNDGSWASSVNYFMGQL